MREYAVHGAINPDTNEIAYGLYVQKPDANWKAVYVSESYDTAGILDCLDFLQTFAKDARNVMCGGYIYPATPEGLASLKADLPNA